MIPIIHEDSDIIVFNKPPGLMVHGDGRSKERTLADMLLEEYPKMKTVGEPMTMIDPKTKEETIMYRPGIVHRLDRDTSGVLIVAKNKKTYEMLKAQFQDREIEKVYKTIVWGRMKEEHDTIDAPMGRSKNDFRKWHAGPGTRGELREAVTRYKVLERLEDEDGNPFTYLEIKPKTGRTHQIRVHMNYVNHPVVGDTLYGRKPAGIVPRLMLHSESLTIEHPKKGKMTFKAPLPEDFIATLAKLSDLKS